MTIHDRPRLRRKDVPAYLAEKHGIDIAYATLEKLACIGGGPAMQYVGRIPVYPKTELDRWAENKLGKVVANTADKAA
jgi:hypothetical protein